MRNILIRIPSYTQGNIGDFALIKTIKELYKSDNLVLPNNEKDLNSIDLSDIDFLIYFGNDCIPYYSISIDIINKFLAANKKVYIINTSWGKNPKEENLDFLKTISNDANFQIYLRDDYSHELIQKDLSFYNKPILTADLAFLCPKSSEPKVNDLENWITANDKPIIGINIHEDFKEFNKLVIKHVKNFIENNKKIYRFLYIPHDSRKDEHGLLKELHFSCKNVDGYVCEYLEPGYEKYIVEKLFLVITGRMHLSILTIPNGVPAIVIAYNGVKAKGSLKHWNMNELVVEPKDTKNLGKIFEKICCNYQNYVERIKRSKDHVERLVKEQLI